MPPKHGKSVTMITPKPTSEGLTSLIRYPIIFFVMSEKFTIFYRPAQHEGQDNVNGNTYQYKIKLDIPFSNMTNGEQFAGIGGECVETGEYKRFRMDRITSMIKEVTV